MPIFTPGKVHSVIYNRDLANRGEVQTVLRAGKC